MEGLVVHAVSFVLGMVFGGVMGFFIVALMVAASRGDE